MTTDKKPQALLNRGKVSFAKYHIIGRDKIESGIMTNPLNKISIAQHKDSK